MRIKGLVRACTATLAALGTIGLILLAMPSVATATCPLAATQAHVVPPSTPAAPEDRTCLVDVRAIGTGRALYDVRSRADYLAFHLAGAQHATVAELSRLLRDRPENVVLYDGGKFRSDTFLLCKRLRDEGLRNFKIIDGGIAAWAQAQARPERVALSRLSDADIAAALSDRASLAVPLDNGFAPVLAEHRIRMAAKGATGRRILVATASTPTARLESSMDGKGSPTLVWTGDPDRLVALIHAHLRQDQKRVAGPVQSTACSAL
ncbi:rhodanese-like domain-containing protein [Lysobacter soli]|uniref:rhodanese-like domain-containing protein n=1 Tax=Lysobacter TaxID=68 RepID=UPI00178A12A1|nr:rhodanese-like domain-containing protein [Lysobacter soli]UTA52661.1 rhodanese-like domain-containing protein [Lysobacter soli]